MEIKEGTQVIERSVKEQYVIDKIEGRGPGAIVYLVPVGEEGTNLKILWTIEQLQQNFSPAYEAG